VLELIQSWLWHGTQVVLGGMPAVEERSAV
jgi:hypothetical protein